MEALVAEDVDVDVGRQEVVVSVVLQGVDTVVVVDTAMAAAAMADMADTAVVDMVDTADTVARGRPGMVAMAMVATLVVAMVDTPVVDMVDTAAATAMVADTSDKLQSKTLPNLITTASQKNILSLPRFTLND